MSHALFPDNTVLCNFASVQCLDLLRDILRDRGRWTEAVAYEARRSSTMLPALHAIPAEGWLGAPIEIDDENDVAMIERVRRAVFGGTPDVPLQHLGEAQTCHVIQTWHEFKGAWWVSDDAEALRFARLQGITTRETIDLMREAVSMGDVTAREGYELLHAMHRADRKLTLPVAPANLQR